LDEFKIFKKTKKYKELTDKNVKIVFNHTRKQVSEKNEKLNEIMNEHVDTSTEFEDILLKIISKENNSLLYEDYKSIMSLS